MAQLIVRNLEDDVHDKLRERAEESGQSLEETVREILRAAAFSRSVPKKGLGTQISELFRGDGLEEPIPELRGQPARPAEFD